MLVEWCFVESNLGIQSFYDQSSSLKLSLPFLYLGYDPVAILQLVDPLPEHFGVLDNLLLADVLDVLPTILLIKFNERVKVSFIPGAESFLQEVFFFLLLFIRQLLGFVNFLLLLLLNSLCIYSKVKVKWDLVSHSVSVVVNFMIQ